MVPAGGGFRFRGFEPGRDEAVWLELNRAAFRHHPEQGKWTGADLEQREAEPWFDPAGLICAEAPDGRLAGFCWVKVDPVQAPERRVPVGPGVAAAGPVTSGEIYVMAVAPWAQGHGLGGRLLAAGLAYMRGRGLTEAELYVDGDNAAALATYRRASFEESTRDTQYAL